MEGNAESNRSMLVIRKSVVLIEGQIPRSTTGSWRGRSFENVYWFDV